MSHVLTISSEKGGVGKSTLALNLGATLADRGLRVLMIDLDAQAAGLTDMFGVHPDGWDLYGAIRRNLPLPIIAAPLEHYPTLDLVAGGPELHDLGPLLTRQPNPALALKTHLETHPVSHDLIILDTPPSLGPVQLAAMAAASWVLIPSPPDHPSALGAQSALQNLEHTRTISPNVRLMGIVPYRHPTRSADGRDQREAWREAVGDDRLAPTIGAYVEVSRAAEAAAPLRDHAPNCPATRHFNELATWVQAKLDT